MHHKAFNATIDGYSSALEGVEAAQRKVRDMKDRLIHAKQLLQVNTADLVQHWVRSRQLKEMIDLLEEM